MRQGSGRRPVRLRRGVLQDELIAGSSCLPVALAQFTKERQF
jgi:hypothetical protein